LSQRYPAQTIDMYDDGLGGERVQPDGVLRLPGVLNNRTPQALLLQEGANDLNALGDAAIPGVISGLRVMIREARGRGVFVFLGTLLPQRPGGRNALAPASIIPANAQIRALAATEGAFLVDLYAAFGGSPDPLIDADGLHATAAGYQRIASTFFTAIQSRFEVVPALTLVRSPGGGAWDR
jgi:lysophospholipase L1-like esterase